jgi:hypothetical protein
VRVAAIGVFAATWLFRWLTVDFANDHFVHLSRARQILVGEIPVRDFFDPGLPLHYYASAAALNLSGQNLLGEAVLTVTLVALGAALTFELAARSARSMTIAVIATIVAVAMFPRLYNYPKVFLYPLALACIWHYAARRTTAALLCLAGLTAVAALFRLDHGFYIGAASAVALVLANIDRIRAVPAMTVRFAAVTVALLLPFVIFIQMTAGIPSYLSDIFSQSSTVTTARVLSMPFTLDAGQPWIVVDPPSPPRVSVRWQPGTNSEQRQERETRYALTDGMGDRDTTWSYVLGDTTPATIQALVNDPLIADTHNIDREAFRPVVRETWIQGARNRFSVLRTRLAPGMLTPANALAWLYYATILVPYATLLVLLVKWRRGTLNPFDLPTIGTAAVLCLVIHQTLVRDSPDSRLPDVAGPTAVLAAWITSVGWHVRWKTARCGVAVLWLATLWSAATFGETGERLSAAGVPGGPAAVISRVREMNQRVQMRPIDWYAPVGSSGVRGLTRYVLECTRPSDRVLTGSFEPQIAFYAERAFAGGQVYLRNGWHGSRQDQLTTIERMRRARVPIVLFSAPTEPEIQNGFPLVYQYVHDNYREVARAAFDGDREYVVLVNQRTEPRSTYAPLGLPCYR